MTGALSGAVGDNLHSEDRQRANVPPVSDCFVRWRACPRPAIRSQNLEDGPRHGILEFKQNLKMHSLFVSFYQERTYSYSTCQRLASLLLQQDEFGQFHHASIQ